MRRLALLALALAPSCGEDEPIVAAPLDPAIAEAEAAERGRSRPAPAADAGHAGPARRVAFRARRQLRFDAKPEWVTGADFDGDGRDDLVVTTLAPGRLYLYSNVGGALSAAPLSLPIAGYALRPAPFELAAGARRGLVVVTRADRTVRLYDPFGERAARARFELELETTPRAFALGALAGNGGAAVVVVGDRGRLSVIAVGADAARRVQELEVATRLPRCLHVSADGRRVLIGDQATRALFVLDVDDEGALIPSSTAIELAGIPRAFAEADLDRDGDAELVVAGGDDAISVFGWGRGGGAARWFEQAPRVWRSAAIPIDLGTRADGLDVLAYGGLSLAAWGALGVDGASRRHEVYAGQTARSSAGLDVDGDGRRDVAIANPDGFAVSLLRGAEEGFAADRRTPVGEFPDGVTLGDCDGDGDLDVVTSDSNDGTLSLCPNEGGRLGERRAIGVGPGPRAVRLTDLDGDGRTDVVLLVQHDAGARLVRLFAQAAGSDAAGTFARRADVPDVDVGPAARDLWLGDATGDGRRELVVVDGESGRVLVLAGAMNGALAPLCDARVGSGVTAVVEVEADGDPLPELALALAGSGERRGVVIGEVRGAAFEELAFAPLEHGPIDLALADLDADGRPELVALAPLGPDGSPGQVVPLRFDPAAPGELVPLVPQTTDLAPRQVAARDVDGDGRAEVVVACQFSHIVDLWYARGAGTELELVRDRDLGAGIGPMAVAFGDLDGDGRPDLVVANGHSGDVSVVRSE